MAGMHRIEIREARECSLAHSGHRDRPIRPIVIIRTGDRDHAAHLDRGVPGGRHGRRLVVTTDSCPVSFFGGVRQAG